MLTGGLHNFIKDIVQYTDVEEFHALLIGQFIFYKLYFQTTT
jgi:hypothetical protein